jgi:phospholipid-binding lipoprotein MlaA
VRPGGEESIYHGEKARTAPVESMRGSGAAIVAMCGLLLAGCTNTPESIAANDPLEPINRPVFAFNETFDHYVELPIAGFYILWMPKPLSNGLNDFLTNIELPIVFTNDVLQGQARRAGETLGRFTLNTTIGLGGFFDVATKHGLPYHHADMGQTLSMYGVSDGPFLVLPIVGPDPPRDLAGDIFDLAIDPLTYLPTGAHKKRRAGVTIGVHSASPFQTNARNVVLREELQKSSLDPYVTMRSVYRQIRAQEIVGGYPDVDDTAGK